MASQLDIKLILAPLLLSHAINQKKHLVSIVFEGTDGVQLQDESNTISSIPSILRYLGKYVPELVCQNDAIKSSQIDYWIDFSSDRLSSSSDFTSLSDALYQLNTHLKLRSYIAGYSVKLADIAVWGALKSNPIFGKHLKSNNKSLGQYLVRWYNHISSLDFVQSAVSLTEGAKDQSNKAKKDQGSFEIGLKDAVHGQVVTRFPPEPSGYLHIGHAKAALLNDYFAKQYAGKLIVRFDDTNPSKERAEFEESIKEDLQMIGIVGDIVTHTSDHFDKLYEYAVELIRLGKAYVDDTPQEIMRTERMTGISSKNRDASITVNLEKFEQMKNATEYGLRCCLRAKMDMSSKNKAMRDTVIYRTNLLPHIKTGDKWKVYPTYDFACPIVDSIEGVTHALRTNEYRDRNEQYEWFLIALNLRRVHIWDFSRMNFVYTLLSKRKLAWFVEQGLVNGWDDARFPTIRGIRRRGLTIEALRAYILMQGASQKDMSLEWDKLWATNKKVIDAVSPRYACLAKQNLVKTIIEDDFDEYEKDILLHKKNEAIGFKKTQYSKIIFLEQEDTKTMVVGEEITLMDWGNAIVQAVSMNDDGVIEFISLKLNLEGDFKKTKKKLTWLTNGALDVKLIDYDYLITKKKLEEEDEVVNYVTPNTEFITEGVADSNIKILKKGDIIQFERKGYYICDQNDAQERRFILIPDGSANSVKSKSEVIHEIKDTKEKLKEPKLATAEKKMKKSTAAIPSMYKVEPFVGKLERIDPTKISKMYTVSPI